MKTDGGGDVCGAARSVRLMMWTGGKCCRQSWAEWRASVHRTACAGWCGPLASCGRPSWLSVHSTSHTTHPHTAPPYTPSPGRAPVITAPQSCNALLSALVIRGNIISVKKTVLQCMNALLVLVLCHRQITILIRRPCDRC